MTTSDYLESLQNDLSRTVEALELEEGTNFTDIAEMAENGDISKGGTDLSEYLEISPSTIADVYNWAAKNYIKQASYLIIPDNVNSIASMFVNWMGNLPKLIFNNNVTSIRNLFGGTGVGQQNSFATTLDASGFNTENVTDMFSSFNGLSGITSLDLSNFRTTKVTTMERMFGNCSSLQSINLSGFTSESLTNIYSMFLGCTSLTSLDMRSFTFSGITTKDNLFGSSSSNYVPANCLIIVKDDTEKGWINTNFSRMTNVKTVAEYEASLNS